MSDPSRPSNSGSTRGTGNPASEAADSAQALLAEQIVAVAHAEGINVRQDADLAEVLVALEVGSDIPVEAFAAVAEILSYIYRANQIHGTPRARPDHPATEPSSPHAIGGNHE